MEAVEIETGAGKDEIFDKDEVDKIIDDWNSGDKGATPYKAKSYYLSRKVFGSVNIQLPSEKDLNGGIPLLLDGSFVLFNESETLSKIDIKLRKKYKI